MLSYARGPEFPILEKTIGEVLDDAAARRPDGDALVSRHQGIRLTWRDLQAAVERTAARFVGASASAPATASACGAPIASSGSTCRPPWPASAPSL